MDQQPQSANAAALSPAKSQDPDHPPHDGKGLSERLNWLRAAVLGVAGATTSFSALITAGIAGLVSGALSMAAGEYVSVSTQRDTEKAAVEHEKEELAELPEAELRELAAILKQKGLSQETAVQAARELTAHDALTAHSEIELGIEPGNYTNPWNAAIASALSFSVGALVPLLAIVLSPKSAIVPVTIVAVVIALLVTGVSSARLGKAPVAPAALRNAAGGLLAMVVTYAIGRLVGTQL